MRLKTFAQPSYWKYQWLSFQTKMGWDKPSYVHRAKARKEQGDEMYTARLQLQYGATAVIFFVLSLVFLMFGSGLVAVGVTLLLLLATFYFGVRTMRVPFLYQPIARSVAMEKAWRALPADNSVVAYVEEPLMIDYWEAVDPLASLSMREKAIWHLNEWRTS